LPKLTPVSWRALVLRLRLLGFNGPYEGGKHPYMVRGSTVLTIPNPHRQEIGVDLLQRILRQGDISREEWIESEE
jgi:predicted RNA binding protein YcfA (HicA-like mRNA interferase family)